LRNFSEQASILAASKTSKKVAQPLHLFRLFATSDLLGCISETMTPTCVRIRSVTRKFFDPWKNVLDIVWNYWT